MVWSRPCPEQAAGSPATPEPVKGADAGDADAMNNLGALYQNGWAVARNHAKAQAWYRKSAFASAEGIVNARQLAVERGSQF